MREPTEEEVDVALDTASAYADARGCECLERTRGAYLEEDGTLVVVIYHQPHCPLYVDGLRRVL